MRLIKMLGLAAVAAVAAMAFIGATSASALNTQLCNSHTALTCGAGNGATSVAWTNLGVGTLLNSLGNVLCLDIPVGATPLALANPQSIHVLYLAFTGCGTRGAHDNCEVEVAELPLALLNKTGLDAGTLTAMSGKIFVYCEDVFLDYDIECEYDATGLQFTVGAQHLTASETPIDEIGSTLNCPSNPTLDALMWTTANRYVLA